MAQWPRIRLPEQETQEAQVPPRGWEGSLEKEMATHSSLLAWSIPWTEGPDGLVYRVAKSQHTRTACHHKQLRMPFGSTRG